MAAYTYTIFDCHPSQGSTPWNDHDDVEIEAESDGEALDAVRDVLEIEGAGLAPEDGYDVGQRIYAMVTDVESDTIVEILSYALTADDLGVEIEEE